MIRLAALALLMAAPASAETLCANAPTPGFAAGQAPLSDRLVLGRAVELGLKPVGGVSFPVPLTRHADAGGLGGVFPLTVPVAGTYRILLSGRAWIDLVRDGAPLVSTEHQHGAPCSGVAKIVAFRLEAGRYDVQLSEAAARTITAKVSREAVLPVSQ